MKKQLNPPKRRELTRGEVLSFMATFCNLAGKHKETEGYLLELLAHVAFTERTEEAKFITA